MNVIIKAFLFGCLLECVYPDLLPDLNLVCSHDRNLNLDVSEMKVYFYDRSRNFSTSFPINNASQGILNYEYLDKQRYFFSFFGGFLNNISSVPEQTYLQAKENCSNCYVIIPDHSPYTYGAGLADLPAYSRSVKYAYYIGSAVGLMLADLNKGGIDRLNMRIVGHSLGAHMAAFAGNNFTSVTGQKIPRITGLDPAGPCFDLYSVNQQLSTGDAEFVDIYDTNRAELGTISFLGNINFVINDGTTQPQCSILSNPLCSHVASVCFWAASEKNPNLFPAYKCDNYVNFSFGACSGNDQTIAGYSNPGTVNGTYYVSTKGYNISQYCANVPCTSC